MFKNFFRIALRYLWRNRTYSTLNFLCLSFGLTCAIIAVLFIMNMFNYDKFHKNYDRLYSVDSWVNYFNGDRFPKEVQSASLDDLVRDNAPEIEASARIAFRSHKFANNDKSFTEQGIYADPDLFSLFSFPLIYGSTKNILSDMNSIVISERMAKTFFESSDCVGKMLVLNDGEKQDAFKVTGVLRNLPTQSTLQFDFVIPFSKFLADNSWASKTGANSNQLWVMLKDKVDRKSVDKKIKDLIKNQETTLNQELFLFPLKEKTLYSYAGGQRVWTGMKFVVIVGCVGLAILLIACFNFINLAMALNMKRYREAGIKKVAGSKKSTLIVQFLGETFILTFLSLLFAIIIVSLLLPGFNMIFRQDIHLQFSDIKVLLFFLAVTFFTGLASGIFPAFYLASSNPVSVLKGKIITDHSYSFLRQSSIVFQFAIPIVLIIAMMIVKVQATYMHNYNPGVNKDSLIVLDNSVNIQKHAESVKAELLTIPGIDAVSFTNCIPSRGTRVSNEVSWEGKDEAEKLHFWCVNADFDYNKTVGIKMKEGRYFNSSFPSDSNNYVINDVAAQVMKIKNPLGSLITLDGKKGTVIGVFTDFHAVDLRGPIVPTIISINPEERNWMLVKFSSGTYSALTAKIGKVYNHYETDTPFKPTIFSDLPSYTNLQTPSNLIGFAAFIGLMLACLGFFGLASFTTESRTKEIGIRKTNGATTSSILRLLLTRYMKWLTIAYCIALPIAFLLGQIFLGTFYFHAAMPFWTFIAGPAIACIIALSTVSSQALRAATQNPVKSLRYE